MWTSALYELQGAFQVKRRRVKANLPSCIYVCRESDEEEVSGSDASAELGADEIEASDDSNVIDTEAPSRKRKAPQTALKVQRLPTGLP